MSAQEKGEGCPITLMLCVQFLNVYRWLPTAVCPRACPTAGLCADHRFEPSLLHLLMLLYLLLVIKILTGLWPELKQDKKKEAWSGLSPGNQKPLVVSRQNSCLSLSALLSLKVVSAWKVVTANIALCSCFSFLCRDAFPPLPQITFLFLLTFFFQFVVKLFQVPTWTLCGTTRFWAPSPDHQC